MTYQEKLKDPRWQKRRLEILSRDKFECYDCQSKTETLHVHHRVYRRGLDPWEYEDSDLVTLCESCHSDITELKKRLDEVVGGLSVEEIGALVDFITHTREAIGGGWEFWLHGLHTVPFCGPKSAELLCAENHTRKLTLDAIYEGIMRRKEKQDA
jgi:hypothetical protein